LHQSFIADGERERLLPTNRIPPYQDLWLTAIKYVEAKAARSGTGCFALNRSVFGTVGRRGERHSSHISIFQSAGGATLRTIDTLT